MSKTPITFIDFSFLDKKINVKSIKSFASMLLLECNDYDGYLKDKYYDFFYVCSHDYHKRSSQVKFNLRAISGKRLFEMIDHQRKKGLYMKAGTPFKIRDSNSQPTRMDVDNYIIHINDLHFP